MSSASPFPQWYVDDQHAWRLSQRALMDAHCAKMLAQIDADMTAACGVPPLFMTLPADKTES